MNRWVEIEFDCLPLRTITRFDIPLDASPKYQAFCHAVKAAIEKHGTHNTYFLHNARCRYHLLNDEDRGLIEFAFQGTVLTGPNDVKTITCDLEVELAKETCDWLTAPVVQWFQETVQRSVVVEFDRYIQAGDLEKAKARMKQIQDASDDSGGFVGMYL